MSAVALLAVTQTAAQAQEIRLGRLLTTPQQRVQLDSLRNQTGKPLPLAPSNPDDVILLPKPVQPSAPAAPQTAQITDEQLRQPLTFNGFVKRSQGPATTWVNQQALPGSPTAQGNRLQLDLPDGKRARLRPGEQLLPGQGVKSILLPATAATDSSAARSTSSAIGTIGTLGTGPNAVARAGSLPTTGVAVTGVPTAGSPANSNSSAPGTR